MEPSEFKTLYDAMTPRDRDSIELIADAKLRARGLRTDPKVVEMVYEYRQLLPARKFIFYVYLRFVDAKHKLKALIS